MKLTLSVAMCTYNGERFVLEQLNSIINQLLPIDEIIICDDCSTDQTISIIYAYSQKHPDISWVIIKNSKQLGITKNFEKAISLCHGDIIFLSDQDDKWKHNKTSKIVDAFMNNPEIGLVFSDAELIDKEGNKKTDLTLFDACGLNQLMKAWNCGLQFEIENIIQRLLGATFGIRREFAMRCIPFDKAISNYHDGQIAMNAVVENNHYMIKDCLIEYRIHNNNIVGLGGDNNWVFSRKRIPDEIAYLIEPRPVNKFFLSTKSEKIKERVSFYQKRYKQYSHITGKIMLMIDFWKYKKFYNQYFLCFYLSDLLYGISKSLRKKVLDYYSTNEYYSKS